MRCKNLVATLKGIVLRLIQFLATESPLKMMKNAFYFTSKAPFVLKIFNFLSWLLVMLQSGFIGKIRLISKFMTSQPGQQTIVIHILSKISQYLIFGRLSPTLMKSMPPESFWVLKISFAKKIEEYSQNESV